MEGLAHLEALCERLYNSQDSAERAHAENTLKCFSTNTEYISQCQYILDNASTPYALMLASSSLLKQVTEHSLSLQLRLDISKAFLCISKFADLFSNFLCGSSFSWYNFWNVYFKLWIALPWQVDNLQASILLLSLLSL